MRKFNKVSPPLVSRGTHRCSTGPASSDPAACSDTRCSTRACWNVSSSTGAARLSESSVVRQIHRNTTSQKKPKKKTETSTYFQFKSAWFLCNLKTERVIAVRMNHQLWDKSFHTQPLLPPLPLMTNTGLCTCVCVYNVVHLYTSQVFKWIQRS